MTFNFPVSPKLTYFDCVLNLEHMLFEDDNVIIDTKNIIPLKFN